jgi:hypothetical protein
LTLRGFADAEKATDNPARSPPRWKLPMNTVGMSTRTSIKSSHWTSATNKPTDADRRRRQRMSSTAVGYLVSDECESGEPFNADPWEVRVYDVSRHGVGFLTAQQMNPGEICRIRIGRGPMRLARRMRVINCTSQGQNLYRVGAEFA